MRKLLTTLLLFALIAASCAGSEEAEVETGSDAETTEAEVETTEAEPEATEAEPETTEAEVEEPAEPEEAEEAVAPPANGVAYELVEWAINGPTDLAAGTVTFNVSNGGEFPHELAVVRGDSYDTLPLLDNGAVDEETLGDDFIGRTETFGSGETVDVDFDLAPGNYVVICNIQVGPNSHAKAGQVLSVTAS